MTDPVEISVSIVPKDDEYPGTLDEQSRLLQSQLREVGIGISKSNQKIPVGAKSAEAIAIGSFAVAVIPKLVPAFVSSIGEWLGAREKRKLVLRLPNGTDLQLTGPVRTHEIIRLLSELKPRNYENP